MKVAPNKFVSKAAKIAIANFKASVFGDPSPFLENKTILLAKMQAISGKEPSELKDGDLEEFDKLESELNQLEKLIEIQQKTAAHLLGQANKTHSATDQQANPATAIGAGGAGDSSKMMMTLPNGSQVEVTDPNEIARLQALKNVKVKEPEFAKDPNRGFSSLREWANGVMELAYHMDGRSSGYTPDPRIESLRVDKLMAQYQSKLADCNDCATTKDVSGSVFVPQGFSNQINKLRPDFPDLNTRKFDMDTLSVPRKYRVDKDHRKSVSGGFQVGRNFENCCIASSKAEYGDYQFSAHPIYGAYCASDLLLMTNPGMVAQEVEMGMDDEFAANRWNEILNGSGKGEYLGAWNSKSTICFTPEAGTNWVDLTIEDIFKMQERFYIGNAANSGLLWIASRTLLTKIKMLKFSVGNDCACQLYDPNGAGPHGTLDGIPIVFTNCVPPCGYKGSLGLYNFDHYEEGTWKPLQNASSEHAMFMCNKKVFKFWKVTAGHPTWERTHIPKCVPNQGTMTAAELEELIECCFTQSPFIVIDGIESDCMVPSRVNNLSDGCSPCGTSSTTTTMMATSSSANLGSSPEEASAIAELQKKNQLLQQQAIATKKQMEALKAAAKKDKADNEKPNKGLGGTGPKIGG